MASEFSSEGFDPFPPIHSDEFRLHSVAEWPDSQIEEKITEYWSFLSQDRMPRAEKAARRILTHLGFEVDYRAGFYTEGENGNL